MDLIHFPIDRRPKVKIQPPVFKGLPGERPDAHLLATADWMEAMRFGPGDFIDHFKHTLQHLACEWYHGLDLINFMATGMNSPHISVNTSPHKVEILSIYMKGGEPFHLIHLLMTLKNTSEM